MTLKDTIHHLRELATSAFDGDNMVCRVEVSPKDLQCALDHIEELREALEYYAKRDIWNGWDRSDVARTALEGGGK